MWSLVPFRGIGQRSKLLGCAWLLPSSRQPHGAAFLVHVTADPEPARPQRWSRAVLWVEFPKPPMHLPPETL